MSAITLQDILDDARVLYDVNYGEKANKLQLFIRQTVNEITKKSSGMLTNRSASLTVASGAITMPSDFETLFAAFYGTQEVVPIDPVTKQIMDNRSLQGSPYGQLKVDSGSIKMFVQNVSNGATIDIAYKCRITDVTAIPELYRYLVLDGVSWRYEKYEQKLDSASYMITYNRFQDDLEDMIMRSSNQDNWTNKFNYLNEWTAILSRI
jgi:hypothetical protein